MARALVCFGGSFDPVHRGHVAVLEAAVAQLPGADIRVLPSRQPPHKTSPRASAEQRVAMLRLALACLPQVSVDERELHQAGVSYTWHSVEALRRQLGERCSISWLMGWDAWLQFTGWHRWRELLDRMNVILVARPGADENALPSALAEHEGANTVDLTELLQSSAGRVARLPVPPVDLSSTQLREALAQGADITPWAPPSVAAYIAEHRLYRTHD